MNYVADPLKNLEAYKVNKYLIAEFIDYKKY